MRLWQFATLSLQSCESLPDGGLKAPWAVRPIFRSGGPRVANGIEEPRRLVGDLAPGLCLARQLELAPRLRDVLLPEQQQPQREPDRRGLRNPAAERPEP